MKQVLLIVFIFLQLSIVAQDPVNIVPVPAELKVGAGSFTIDRNTSIVLVGTGMENTAAYFNEYLQQYKGFRLEVVQKNNGSKSVVLTNRNSSKNNPEGYELKVDTNGIFITGETGAAVFYGIQTLIQLLPIEKNTIARIPFVSVNDRPRFRYRGMHLDVARHFMPVDNIKKYIDYLALHKLNTFHWHLTDDQGWRIEIKKYPGLTEAGARRNGTIIGRYPGKRE
jgi:hexosaminidase